QVAARESPDAEWIRAERAVALPLSALATAEAWAVATGLGAVPLARAGSDADPVRLEPLLVIETSADPTPLVLGITIAAILVVGAAIAVPIALIETASTNQLTEPMVVWDGG